jgi:membrane fusion protein, copper/silver efflux system
MMRSRVVRVLLAPAIRWSMTRAAGFSVLILAAATLAGASWYARPDRHDITRNDPRKVLYYVDPMHPAYTSDRPGKAPDCGMSLTPVYEDAGLVRVRPDMQGVIGVRTETVATKPAAATLRLFGRVAPDETRLYRITAGTDGYVSDVSHVTTGSRVEAGAWLVTIAAPDARTPIQAYLVALDAQEQGTQRPADTPGVVDRGLEQAEAALLTMGMSRAQIDEIRHTRRASSSIRMTAPAAGYVLDRRLAAGRVAAGEELFRIADLRRVWILADVSSRDAQFVRPGADVEIAVPGLGRTMRGAVSAAVAPQFDAASQTVSIRLDADNPDGALRPGMAVDVHVRLALPPGIAVPVDAVLDTGLKKRVFVERGQGLFEPREVETGWRAGERVEIVRGLSAGERVVVSGTFLLDSETRLRRAPVVPRPPP